MLGKREIELDRNRGSQKHRKLTETDAAIRSLAHWFECFVRHTHEREERRQLDEWLSCQRRFVVIQTALSQHRDYHIDVTTIASAIQILRDTGFTPISEELAAQWRRLSIYLQRTQGISAATCDALTFTDLQNHPIIERIQPGDRGQLESELNALFSVPLASKKFRPVEEFKGQPDPSASVNQYVTGFLRASLANYVYLIQRHHVDQMRCKHQAVVTKAVQRCEQDMKAALSRPWDKEPEDLHARVSDMMHNITDEMTSKTAQPDFSFAEYIPQECEHLMTEIKSASKVIKANRDEGTEDFYRLSALRATRAQAQSQLHLASQCMDACQSISREFVSAKQSMDAYKAMHSRILSIITSCDAEIAKIQDRAAKWLERLQNSAVVFDAAHFIHEVLLKTDSDINAGLEPSVCRERFLQLLSREFSQEDLTTCGKLTKFRTSLNEQAKSVTTEQDDELASIKNMTQAEHECWDWRLPIADASSAHTQAERIELDHLTTQISAADAQQLDDKLQEIQFSASDEQLMLELGFTVEYEAFKKRNVCKAGDTLAQCLHACSKFMCKLAIRDR